MVKKQSMIFLAMQSAISQLFFIPGSESIILNSALFMLILGFVYGYFISFVFGIKRTLELCFFITILVAILVFIFTGGIVFSEGCTAAMGGKLCNDAISIISSIPGMLMLIVSNLLVDITIGYVSSIIGIGLYFPSDWMMKKYFHVALQPAEQEKQDGYTTVNITGNTNKFNAELAGKVYSPGSQE